MDHQLRWRGNSAWVRCTIDIEWAAQAPSGQSSKMPETSAPLSTLKPLNKRSEPSIGQTLVATETRAFHLIFKSLNLHCNKISNDFHACLFYNVSFTMGLVDAAAAAAVAVAAASLLFFTYHFVWGFPLFWWHSCHCTFANDHFHSRSVASIQCWCQHQHSRNDNSYINNRRSNSIAHNTTSNNKMLKYASSLSINNCCTCPKSLNYFHFGF